MMKRQLVHVPPSTPDTESTVGHVIVASTANLKMCVYELPNAKLSYIGISSSWVVEQNRPKCNPSFCRLSSFHKYSVYFKTKSK